jgi:hypothetical protein
MTYPVFDTTVTTESVGAHEGAGDPWAALPEGPARLGAMLHATLELGRQVVREQQRMSQEFLRLNANTPVDWQVQTNGLINAAGTLLLTLGSPDPGTYWQVQQCVAGGTDANVTCAGTGALYVSGSSVATGGLLSCADIAKTLPNVGFYGTRDVIVNASEFLLFQFFGGTVGQAVSVAASVSVFTTRSAGGRGVTIE